MLVISESRLREIIRSEIERFQEEMGENNDLTVVNYETGASVILPNFIKERFDNNSVNSIADIL